MFDIGFLEILVILVIALLVIGPERMPEVARKIGQFMGKMRRFVNTMKEEGQVQETLREIKDSMNLEEEKRQIDNLSKELEQGLNYGDVNLEDFQRPFGGDTLPSENPSGSQFNKAPAQPKLPAPAEETQASSKPESTSSDIQKPKVTETSVSQATEAESKAPEKDISKS